MNAGSRFANTATSCSGGTRRGAAVRDVTICTVYTVLEMSSERWEFLCDRRAGRGGFATSPAGTATTPTTTQDRRPKRQSVHRGAAGLAAKRRFDPPYVLDSGNSTTLREMSGKLGSSARG